MINLQPLSWDNYVAVYQLQVEEHQKGYLAPNYASLAEAYLMSKEADGCPQALFAICNNAEVVGFAMIDYIPSGEGSYANYAGGDGEACYYLSRFMLDKRFQGQGLGKSAMDLIIDYVKTRPLGETASFYTSFKPENEVMRKFIAKCGFVETGKINQGEVITKIMF
ncbi:MAG: GNAT family N-acetyltransferase [Defluviitaleaceae bacterium]|nr:GNAT family N-acetyltransferase [Defluviitaleaceae bacterium]